MKGFYISVKNDLLEPKHVEAMGPSIWLYLWLLDKMTSVSEAGYGMVLGGKPIALSEIQDDLGITERTYQRWISQLRRAGYINTVRAPYGLVIGVHKAAKRFKGRTAKNGVSLKTSPVPPIVAGESRQKRRNQSRQKRRKDTTNVAVKSAKNGGSNKTVSKTITVDSVPNGTGSATQVDRRNPDVQKVIEAFALMDYKLTNEKQQRQYAGNLIRREGAGEVVKKLRQYYQRRADRFCPTITSPKDLWYKWDQLRTYLAKLESVKSKKKAKVTEV